MTKFSAGDEVRLNSGGPGMTVEANISDQVVCVWFHDNDLKRATFPEASLKYRTKDTAGIVKVRSRWID